MENFERLADQDFRMQTMAFEAGKADAESGKPRKFPELPIYYLGDYEAGYAFAEKQIKDEAEIGYLEKHMWEF